MNRQYVVEDIQDALKTRQFPTVASWNRLEGRPRTDNFDRAAKAEVRDALWMLMKQWQMGEFRADDAGSILQAKVQVSVTGLRKYKAGLGAVEPFDDSMPLEARVERRPIPFLQDRKKVSLDIRLFLGRQWLKMLKAVGNYASSFVQKYPIKLPDPTRKEDAIYCAHPEVWQTFAAVAGRCMDGAALYFYLKADPAHHAYDGIPVLSSQQQAIDLLAKQFVQWFEGFFYQPTSDASDAWVPDRMEYQFACSAPEAAAEKVLVADQYYQGRLDWFNFDIDASRSTLGAVQSSASDPRHQDIQSLMPVQITYPGMPNSRWWAFEDGNVNFGGIKPDTTDLGKLLFIEFGLVYANDWFLIPYVLPAGSVARVRGLAVTNVFGERFWIEAAGSGAGNAWQRWNMFTLDTAGNAGVPDTSLLLLPTVPKVQDGGPLEEIMLLRDEVADMVWGVERTVLMATGTSKPGSEAATETMAYYSMLLADELRQNPALPGPVDYKANISYQVMASVPEYWIPFVPVHVAGDNREIQLQRAAMPRILEGDPNQPEKVRPRTMLLREGLDRVPASSYFIHEEEVPRAGALVRQSYQRTRWTNGKVLLWLGAQKQTGRGEGASQLAFDQLRNVTAK
jgi:hypothetical protein